MHIPSHVPSNDMDFQRLMSWSFSMFNELRWKVIVSFVDIGEFVDHHCWYILFITPNLFVHISTHPIRYGCQATLVYRDYRSVVVQNNGSWAYPCGNIYDTRYCYYYMFPKDIIGMIDRVYDCCLMPIQQFFSYIMARTS